MRTGTANLPLHGGHCPPWLFEKMKELGVAIIEVIVDQYGTSEVLRRFADPVWFQSLGCLLGFDWHSSGLTTVLCGAIKEGLQHRGQELGIFMAGGKGRASRRTPEEIHRLGSRFALDNRLTQLEYASRITAKVDSNLVQDGYQLYHHVLLFDHEGEWAVVQQGMHQQKRSARRYHWLSDGLVDFVHEPHSGICGRQQSGVLDLTAHANEALRDASIESVRLLPGETMRILKSGVQSSLILSPDHPVPQVTRLNRILHQLYERPPQDYEELTATPGVGARTLRALAMVAEVAFGARPAFRDPVRYAFAHGGKDGHPFPIDRTEYERTLALFREALNRAKLGQRDKMEALRRLSGLDKARLASEQH